MWRFDPDRVRRNVQRATDEDLLDRVTVYREGMQPEALEIIEEELLARDIGRAAVEAHAQRREGTGFSPGGGAARCSFCRRPALVQGRGWHRLWGVLPLFPRTFAYCETHRPQGGEPGAGVGK